MSEGETARAPIGHVVLCAKTPEACDAGAGAAEADDRVIRLGRESWRALADINTEVNRRIRPRPDGTDGGAPDVWSINPVAGDCEDYALTKREALIREGLPAAALLVAVVRDERGDHHAVLVARTDRGDFVLDNRRAAVRAWSELPYRWIKRQSAADPRRWVRLDGYAEEMVERKQELLRRFAQR